MKLKENLFKATASFCAFLSIVFLLAIIISIFKEGLPIFKSYGVFKFLFTTSWHPTHEEPTFGILALIVGSLAVTLGSLIVAIPLGIGSAVYLSEVASVRTRELLKPFVELLASIPSVIYGLFGMAFLAPFVMRIFNLSTGLNLFTASIVLGIMIVPIIASISEDIMSALPAELREAAYALGANRWETISRVILPAAKSGIFASIILGFGRAIGETMLVLMVAGGAAIIPKSIFSPVRPMTSAIAAEMGETIMGSDHYHALFGIAIVLFIVTFVSNILTEFIRRRVMREFNL
ncbi:MAG: phosphate ABC transporter permease subunit PstC [candidate division WOR-3 bacterium]|nr:phosphate ABC transporter permease subunit PstC [candidate division WOR-3 bacterium]MDW7987983.1 phosphate ABC transporter permease subunit PstC [candidate division WOR-3 bacterium]